MFLRMTHTILITRHHVLKWYHHHLQAGRICEYRGSVCREYLILIGSCRIKIGIIILYITTLAGKAKLQATQFLHKTSSFLLLKFTKMHLCCCSKYPRLMVPDVTHSCCHACVRSRVYEPASPFSKFSSRLMVPDVIRTCCYVRPRESSRHQLDGDKTRKQTKNRFAD